MYSFRFRLPAYSSAVLNYRDSFICPLGKGELSYYSLGAEPFLGFLVKGKGPMNIRIRALAVGLLFASVSICLAKEHDYQKGKLLRMDSSSCGTSEKGSKTVAGEIFGTDGQHKQTQELLCQEYILQADHVIYRIRPKDDKHPVLLPIGEIAQFRINKDKLILRVPEVNDKEHEYIVVSMMPREDKDTPAQTASK